MSSAAGKPEWTKEQDSAVRTTGRNLLVSAAAGSGKTAVLAERCAYLVCDAPNPCDVDELLVVTFTEAAAAEMKKRIGQSLRQRAQNTPTPRLLRQLALIDHAQVSTLHGFCAKLLRQHFHRAGIDPGFRILSQEEAPLLRREVAEELVRETFESSRRQGLADFLDAYCDGEEKRLISLLAWTHEMRCSLVDPDRWVAEALAQLQQAAEGPIEASSLGKELIQWINDGIDALSAQCHDGLSQLQRLGGFPAYIQRIQDCFLPALGYWKQVLDSDGLDALAEVAADLELPKLKPVSNGTPNKDLAKGIIDDIAKQMKEGRWRKSLLFTTQQWRDGLARTLPHATAFLALVREFGQRYQSAKDAIRALDFADLERRTLKVLTEDGEPSATAIGYQRRFAHVLVDEYQDINELQDELLSLLSHERARPGDNMLPNLFCVGDVKQSIYGFRLADPERFLSREKKLRTGDANGAVIDLQANFRTRDSLLEAINGVFERLMTPAAADIAYDQTHRLFPRATFPPPPPESASLAFSGGPIELHALPDLNEQEEVGEEDRDLERSEREASFIVQRIRQLMGTEAGHARRMVLDRGPDGSPMYRPIRYSDIVILLRATKFRSEQFSRILDLYDIPVYADSATGFFSSMEIRDVLAVLQILDNARQDIPLATILRSPLGGLPNAEDSLAEIRLAYPPTDRGQTPFHEAVVRYSREKNDELAAHLRDLLAQLQAWRETAQRRPLDELLGDIYTSGGYFLFVQGMAQGKLRVANLRLLRDKARQFGTFDRPSLSRFLKFLERIEEESDLGIASTANAAEDVVRIMSVHASKGLQFPVVFLADLGKRFSLKDSAGHLQVDRSLGLGLKVVDTRLFVRYPSLALMLIQRHRRQQSMAEELRILYVAMTRVKEHLILVGTIKQKAFDSALQKWPGHRGPLPADEILGASTMLDWILAVASASTGQRPAIFDLSRPTPAQFPAIPRRSRRGESEGEKLELAQLQPLNAPPGISAAAQAVIDRLERRYPFESATHTRAAQSVTGRAETPEVNSAIKPPPDHDPLPRTLDRPVFLRSEAANSPTERGTATHLVLQHLDWRRPCDKSGVAAQIQEMIDRQLISPQDALLVEQNAIVWFAASEVGLLLREHADELWRELPVYFTLAKTPAESADQPMVRGRLDLLLALPDGHVIIDYKTDRVTEASLAEKTEAYRRQIDLYQTAIERITGKPVRQVYLIFLTARKVLALSDRK